MNFPKVIFLSPVEFFKGGAERCLIDMMLNPSIKPILIVPEEGELKQRAEKMGIKCYTIPFGSIKSVRRPFSFIKSINTIGDLIRASRALKDIGELEGSTIIHSNGLKAHVISCLSTILFRTKSIVHIHDIPYTKSEKMIWNLMQLVCTKMLIVSRPCWPTRKIPQNVVIVHNGTEIYDSVQNRNSLDSEMGISLGFCGRIHPAKGLHILLDWISKARQKNLNLILNVKGDFSSDAPSYEAEIKQIINNKKMNNYVNFHGFISNQNDLYQDLDIVVVPSNIPDPLPRSVMEAMARGIVVFGYPSGGIIEMIDDQKTGFLVKTDIDFENAIKRLISEKDLYSYLANNSVKKISEEFSLKNLHKKLSSLYQEQIY